MITMLIDIWNTVLYQPLFNALIFIYNNWTDQNLGWAIVYLTIILRVVLLPLTIVHLMRTKKNQELQKEVAQLEHQYKNDPILQKQEIRRVLKHRHVNPWAKALSLGVQGLVLVLLYEVFLGGISGSNAGRQMLDLLYPSVAFPGTINIMFFGANLGATHTIMWPAITSILLLIENYVEISQIKKTFVKKDLNYLIMFPLSIFVVLWILPVAKSVFVFTSMVFSIIVNPVLSYMFGPKPHKEK